MSGVIASNMGAASQKKAEILSAVDEYTSFTTQSAAGTSDGVPPADHDNRAQRYSDALSTYASSLTRDADALGEALARSRREATERDDGTAAARGEDAQ